MKSAGIEHHMQNELKEGDVYLKGDNPIETVEEDTIGRNSYAQSFAKQILTLDVQKGAVVGVLGAWGSGKTSFINLALNGFKGKDRDDNEIVLIDFNPWMFSGTEQLMQRFFNELSVQLRLKSGFEKIGEYIDNYGEVLAGLGWLPVAGKWVESGHSIIKLIIQVLWKQKEGIGEKRKRIEDTLIKNNKKIIVVIDDIDRLSSGEIRDIFKLVRLTANFPNMIYVLAFDRTRIERALEDEGINGRDYLEKILQIVVDIPSIPNYIIRKELLDSIQKSLEGIENEGVFHQDRWSDIFEEIIRPLIKTMRDVRRYAVNLRGTVISLDGQVALEDVLALEAIRIFLPDVFGLLHTSTDALTTVSRRIQDNEYKERMKSKIDNIIDKNKLANNMIFRLFPAARRHLVNYSSGKYLEFEDDNEEKWLKENYVAHREILQFYLERFLERDDKVIEYAKQVKKYRYDLNMLQSYVQSIDKLLITDVLFLIEDDLYKYEEKYIVRILIAFSNCIPFLSDEYINRFELSDRDKVGNVVLNWIKRIAQRGKGRTDYETIEKEIVSNQTTLSAKYALVTMMIEKKLSYRSEMTKWAEEVKETPKDVLVKEPELLKILSRANEYLEQGDKIEIEDDEELTLTILKSASSQAMSQSLDSRYIRTETHLAWERLINLYGSESRLINNIDKVRQRKRDEDKEILEIADKYISGWRPEKD